MYTGDLVMFNDQPGLAESLPAQQDVSSFYVADSTIHGRGVFAGRGFGEDEAIGTYQGLPTQKDGTYVLWLYEDK